MIGLLWDQNWQRPVSYDTSGLIFGLHKEIDSDPHLVNKLKATMNNHVTLVIVCSIRLNELWIINNLKGTIFMSYLFGLSYTHKHLSVCWKSYVSMLGWF